MLTSSALAVLVLVAQAGSAAPGVMTGGHSVPSGLGERTSRPPAPPLAPGQPHPAAPSLVMTGGHSVPSGLGERTSRPPEHRWSGFASARRQAEPASAPEAEGRDPAEGDDGAADEPSPAPTGIEPEGARRDARRRDRDGDGKIDNWIDVGHAFVERRIFTPILRLDRFFADERDFDAERSRSFVRWRNQVYFTEDASGATFATGLHANLRLPGLHKQLRRLRVVVAGETRDALQSLFARRGAAGSGGEDDGLGAANAGLRLYFLDTLFSHADLGAGILTRLPPGLYGLVRFRTAIPVRELFLTRSVLTGFWRTDTRFGTSAGLELERPVTANLVTRLSGSASLTEVSHGVEWVSELAAIAYVEPSSAAHLAVAVNGATRPPLASDGQTRRPDLDRVRLYTRLRRDVFRRWIFVELEPEVARSWTLAERRHWAWGVTFRLEVQFHGAEVPPPRPPDETSDEPPDPPDPTEPAKPPASPIRSAPGG